MTLQSLESQTIWAKRWSIQMPWTKDSFSKWEHWVSNWETPAREHCYTGAHLSWGDTFSLIFFSLDFAPCCLHCGWDLWSTVKKCMFRFQNKRGHYKWSHQPLANSSLWTPHEQQSKSHDTHKLQKRLKHKGKQAWLSTLVKDILMWLYFCYPFFFS